MQEIKAHVPQGKSPFFLYVCPLPPRNERNDHITKRDMVSLNTGKHLVEAERHSYFDYEFKSLPDSMCKLAYGYTADEMRRFLKQKFPNITDNTLIGFYIYKKINVKQLASALPAGFGF